MFNPKLILNAASELNLSVKTNGKFYQVVKKIDQFKPKNKEDILTLDQIETDLFKTIQLDLNELKKVRMTIKILKSGVEISKRQDLNQLKELKIENLIDINPSTTLKVHEILLITKNKEEFLQSLKNKDNQTIINEYNLMPQTTLMILIMFVFLIVSIIPLYLGFSYLFLSKQYSFFNETTAFWTMFLGGLALLLSTNSFFRNVYIKMKEIKDKQKIYNELATKFLNKREKNINKTLFKLSKKQFEIEKKSIQDASVLKLKEVLSEETNLLNDLRNNFT
jgi:hypothetical protein|tara:strand:- start:144 stop:980 length:837 start_codon:yes stop_codon:yes gene_type:complete